MAAPAPELWLSVSCLSKIPVMAFCAWTLSRLRQRNDVVHQWNRELDLSVQANNVKRSHCRHLIWTTRDLPVRKSDSIEATLGLVISVRRRRIDMDQLRDGFGAGIDPGLVRWRGDPVPPLANSCNCGRERHVSDAGGRPQIQKVPVCRIVRVERGSEPRLDSKHRQTERGIRLGR